MRKNLENITAANLEFVGGCFDSYGTIRCQILEGPAYKYGFTISVSIVFRHTKDKTWLIMKVKDTLGFGEVKKLKHVLSLGSLKVETDSIVEYVISSIDAVETLLCLLKPFVVSQRTVLFKTLRILIKKRKVKNVNDFLAVCRLVDKLMDELFGVAPRIDTKYVQMKIENNFPVETLQKK